MNAGLHELPLVFFTVLAQSAVGAWLVFTFVLFGEKSEKSRAYIHKAMFVILAFLGLGFIASIMHLGSPMRAFNSLNRVGEFMANFDRTCGYRVYVCDESGLSHRQRTNVEHAADIMGFLSHSRVRRFGVILCVINAKQITRLSTSFRTEFIRPCGIICRRGSSISRL